MIGKTSFFQYRLKLIILLAGIIIAGSAVSETKGFELMRPALAIYRLGNYTSAAENWVNVATEIQKNSIGRDDEILKQAALANIAATIAFNKAGDARGYSSWAQAIQNYLEGQTEWEAERAKLRLKLKEITYNLKAANSTSGQPPISGDELLLLEFDQVLGLTEFTGPRPGLRDELPAGPQESTGRRREDAFGSRGAIDADPGNDPVPWR